MNNFFNHTYNVLTNFKFLCVQNAPMEVSDLTVTKDAIARINLKSVEKTTACVFLDVACMESPRNLAVLKVTI